MSAAASVGGAAAARRSAKVGPMGPPQPSDAADDVPSAEDARSGPQTSVAIKTVPAARRPADTEGWGKVLANRQIIAVAYLKSNGLRQLT